MAHWACIVAEKNYPVGLGRWQSHLFSRLLIDVWGQAEDEAAFFFELEITELHFKVNQQRRRVHWQKHRRGLARWQREQVDETEGFERSVQKFREASCLSFVMAKNFEEKYILIWMGLEEASLINQSSTNQSTGKYFYLVPRLILGVRQHSQIRSYLPY